MPRHPPDSPVRRAVGVLRADLEVVEHEAHLLVALRLERVLAPSGGRVVGRVARGVEVAPLPGRRAVGELAAAVRSRRTRYQVL